MQQEGVIAIFRFPAVPPDKAAKLIVLGIQTAGPVLVGKRRVGDGKVEALELVVALLPLGRGQGIALPDLGGRIVVQDHVHARQGAGGVIHLLTVDGEPLGPSLVTGLEQQEPEPQVGS